MPPATPSPAHQIGHLRWRPHVSLGTTFPSSMMYSRLSACAPSISSARFDATAEAAPCLSFRFSASSSDSSLNGGRPIMSQLINRDHFLISGHK